LRAGLDVPAVVLRQRQAAALDQPERLHAGGSHQLRDPPDGPREGRERPCILRVRREGYAGQSAAGGQRLRALPRRSRRVRRDVRAVLSDAASIHLESGTRARRAGPRHTLRRTIRLRMTQSSHPLDRPLPPDVAAGESAFIQFYQQYAVFSLPWAWRRTVIFGSIGVLGGISFGASHGLYVRDVSEAIVLSLASSLAGLVLVGAGPMLAALFRHAGLPLRIERVCIVAAVICGMVLGTFSDQFADQFHDRLMAAHGFGHES